MSIEARNISKTFGKLIVLDNVSLEVKTGELVALLGPSGSGKTTLLRIIAGLERPDPGAGEVLLEGEDVARRQAGKRGVGFVFQHYALFRHMNVFDNIAFGLSVKPRAARPSKAEIRERVHKLVQLVQLEPQIGRYPHQLSGGQRQRVALARALAVEPRVLLLDEPFGALDAKVRVELRQWLRRLHDELHVTSVLVTHDQDEALEVADRVVVMNHGKIEQVGSPDEVFNRPASEFVMDFLGQVNRFHGQVTQGRVKFADVQIETPEQFPREGASARIFVRPHDVEVTRARNGHPALQTTLLRVRSAGPAVRLTLKTSTGEELQAEISHEQFAQLKASPGDTLFAAPHGVRVFTDRTADQVVDEGAGI
ncbi:MAG TPA: sulfate ABC transporter ATP-binding protein [Phycisphaerae bacterium]|nr:sulfate ABC transporter ATP-binding protein [Phycisphaerae bacterium]